MRDIIYISVLFFSFNIVSFAQKEAILSLQEQFNTIENGGIINIEAGVYELDQTLSLKDKKEITIKGAGADQTILLFKKLKKNTPSIEIANAQEILLEGITIQNKKGVGIKTYHSSKITFLDIHVKWLDKPKKSNGSYGFYIDNCTKTTIKDIEIVGASNTGIFVNQSDKITIRRGNIHQNAVGIKFENTKNGEIYKNTIHNNRTGLVILDSPNSNNKKGGFTRIYNNRIIENNHKKFSSNKHQTLNCPRGTGVLIAASNDIELFNNEIESHQSFGLMITSYFFIQPGIHPSTFDPYPYRISVHDNWFKRKEQQSAFRGTLKSALNKKFKEDLPHIGMDGIFNPKQTNEYGWLNEGYRICIHDNEKATLVNFDAAHNFENIDTKPYPFRCKLVPFRGLIDEPSKAIKYESNEVKQ